MSFVVGGERLNSQILPRGFSRKRCAEEKRRGDPAWKLGSVYLCCLANKIWSREHTVSIQEQTQITAKHRLALKRRAILYIVTFASLQFPSRKRRTCLALYLIKSFGRITSSRVIFHAT